MQFCKITPKYYLDVKNLLPQLELFYDGHQNSRFYNQIISKDKKDSFGYFTLKKEIWLASENNEFRGFICLNYKRGGSVKIGPFMVVLQFRGKGVGRFLIKSAMAKLKSEKIRKIYATTPAENIPAKKLFEDFGFNIELELLDQYREKSREYVWGYFYQKPSKTFDVKKSLLISRKLQENNLEVQEFNKAKDMSIVNKAINILKYWHCDIDDSFVEQIIRATKRGMNFERKGKLILVTKKNNTPYGIGVAVPKRGGSVKVYPLFGDKLSQCLLINKMRELFKKNGYRKIYTFAHVNDKKLICFLKNYGFTSRGQILSPYKSGHDLIVLDLFL